MTAAPKAIDKTRDQEIVDLVGEVREAQSCIAEMEERIEQAKEKLRDLLENRGENWSDEEGYARLTSPGERISYDTKLLDDLLISNPLQYGWLKDYRRKTPVQGGLQVK